jgi:hypothetical protein
LVNSLNDPIVISKISQLKEEKQNSFQSQFQQCISVEELRKKTTEFIQSLPWKNNNCLQARSC